MKRINSKLIVLSCLLVLVAVGLSGCLRLQTEIDMDMDGSGRLSYDVGIDSSLYQFMQLSDEDILEELRARAEERGYSVEDYEDEEFIGLKLEGEFADPDELGEELGLLGLLAAGQPGADEDEIRRQLEENVEYSHSEGVFSDVYTVDARINMQNLELGEELDQMMSDMVYDQFDMGLALNLPLPAREHNASVSENNDRYLQWQFEMGQENQIYFEARVLNWLNIIAGAGVLLFVIVLFLLSRRGIDEESSGGS